MTKIKKLLGRILPTPAETFHKKMHELSGMIGNLELKISDALDSKNNEDEKYLHADAPMPHITRHPDWTMFMSKTYNKEGMKILEIGSRAVTGFIPRKFFPLANYVGFDIIAGENVDVIGDAHKLSSYFDSSEKFDLVFSLFPAMRDRGISFILLI